MYKYFQLPFALSGNIFLGSNYKFSHNLFKLLNYMSNYLQEGESERFRYKLAANLVLSKDNEQRSNIIERAKKIPLKEDFLSLK